MNNQSLPQPAGYDDEVPYWLIYDQHTGAARKVYWEEFQQLFQQQARAATPTGGGIEGSLLMPTPILPMPSMPDAGYETRSERQVEKAVERAADKQANTPAPATPKPAAANPTNSKSTQPVAHTLVSDTQKLQTVQIDPAKLPEMQQFVEQVEKQRLDDHQSKRGLAILLKKIMQQILAKST